MDDHQYFHRVGMEMINITREGTTVLVKVRCNRNGYTYNASYECGSGREDYAILLREALADGLFNTIRNARSEAYDQGFKDAKKKTRRQDWFSGSFD